VASVLEPAQAAGTVRADLEPSDLLRLGHGIGGGAKYADEAGTARLLSVLFDGLRAPRPSHGRTERRDVGWPVTRKIRGVGSQCAGEI
jgi:hypothetical protein